MFQNNILKKINFEEASLKINLILVFVPFVMIFLMIKRMDELISLILQVSICMIFVFVPISIFFGLKTIFIDRKISHGIARIGLGIIVIIANLYTYLLALLGG